MRNKKNRTTSPFLNALKRGHKRRRLQSAGAEGIEVSLANSESLEQRALLSGTPIASASVGVPDDVFVGEDFDLTITFDNTGTDPGYGPILDVVLPTNGADGAAGTATADGLTTTGPATYLGVPVTTQEFVFPDDGGGTGTIDHPFFVDNTGSPLQVTGTAGDTLVVMELPFGSFTVDQPAAALTLPVSMSDLADVGTDLDVRARAGFRFGCDELDNPTTDPSIVSDLTDDSTAWTANATVTPILAKLTKTNLAPEFETATGPNFVRQYEIVVEVAEGQTLTNFDVTDLLPPEIVYMGDGTVNVTPAVGHSVITSPNTDKPYAAPDNELTIRVPSVTGATGNVGFTITFDFYVARLEADDTTDVIDPVSGDDEFSLNEASGTADWDPTDARDANTSITLHEVDGGPDDRIEDRSIAIQKSVSNVSDAQNTPGDILVYTLDFQISDFFAFEDVFIDDLMSDGQRFNDGFVPTLEVTEHGTGHSAAFDLTNFTVADNFTGTSDAGFTEGNPNSTHIVDNTLPAGSQELRFRISDELISKGLDGRLVGGCVPQAGVGAGVPDCAFNGGGTTGRITYQAIIQENFSDDAPSSDLSVDQGDQLSNTVDIDGALLDVADATTPHGTREADDSGAVVTIARGTLEKSVYAINGSTSFATGPIEVTPGDAVTYRLRMDVPSSDIEDLEFIDYLPLPLFDATQLTTVDDVTDATIPAVGHVKFLDEAGPEGDTFSGTAGVSGIVPVLTQLPGNAFSLFYDDFDSGVSARSDIDILFTVEVLDKEFADGLFHTNQVRQLEGSTNNGPSNQDSIVQIQIRQPDLNVRKGVIATNNPAGSFTSAVGPVSFSAPGSGGYRGSGTVNSDGLAATPINSNLTGIDAGDLVSFALVVENTGGSRRGAFDVQLRDTIPAGFSIPTGGAGLNLTVTDGTGTVLSTTPVNGGDTVPLFENGLEVVDPGATAAQGDQTDAGALDEFDATDGQNILIVTYDLIADADVEPDETLTNTVTLFNYSSLEGGEDYTSSDLTDTATVTTADVNVTKSLTATNQAHTTGNDVAIGEVLTYQVVVDIPEGVSTGVSLVDTLDAGLAFVDGSLSIVPSSGNITFTGAGTASFSAVGSGGTAAGRRMTVDFGTVTNSNVTSGTSSESFTITYQTVVLNTATNNRGDSRNNSARWQWSEGSDTDGANNVTIVEPELNVTKSFGAGTEGEAGDSFTVTLTLAHTGASNADAFEVSLEDILPTGMAFAGNLTHDAGLAPTTLSESGGTISASWPTFTLADTSTISFDISLTGAVVPGTTVTNSATTEWTGLPGDVTTAQSAENPNSVERTGDNTDPGELNDYNDSASDGIDIIIPVPTKTIEATSEAHTSGADVAIGEIVRYRLQAVLPQGTSPNFRLIDHLPTGLSFHDATQVRVSWSADNDITEAAELAGADNDAVAPTFVLPASRISTAGSNVTFDLGNLVNNDDDPDVETITLEFNAITSNIAVNSIPFTHDNTFSVEVNGGVVATSPPVTTTLVEPVINNVSKQVIDIGSDVVTYQVTFSNTGTATAFDVSFADALPGADLGLRLGSISMTPAGGASAVVDTSAGNTVSGTLVSMPVGSSVTIEYTADVLTPDAAISNTMDVLYTSLPVDGTAVNPTGSTTPPGDERDGSGGVDDYSDSDTKQIGALGDFVWLDNDSGGDQDSGELGIAGVDVQLVWPGPDGDFGTAGDNVTLTTTTDNDGFYTFNGLPSSDYRVSVLTGTLPGALTQTFDIDGTGTVDTATVTLGDGEVRDDVDFGYVGPGSIGDTIFLDEDGDDTPDTGEGISGVELTLTGDFDGDGVDEVLTTTTAADGTYLFDGLPVDNGSGSVDYTVAVNTGTLPAGVVLTFDPEGAADNTSDVTLTPGSPDNLDQDYGYRGTGQIGDTIFLDVNNNGVPDPGEGIEGVRVTLTGDHDGDGIDEVISATTDASGNYLFDHLVTDDGSAGGIDYTVDVDVSTLPDGVSQTVDPDASMDNSSQTTLTNASNTDLTRDFGYRGTGQVGDTVFLDANGNGVPDAGEGISGVTLTLTGDHDGDGIDEVLTTTTDADGNYLFGGLVTNDGSGGGIDYTVDVGTGTLPAGVSQTVDPDATMNDSSPTTLTDASSSDLTRDFGYQATGQIGDTIFLDVNNNGVPDAGEGIAGVRVTLTGDHDGDGIDEVLSTTTDSSGNYLFDGLVTNDGSGGGVQYTVDVDPSTLPSGVTQTVDPDATSDNSSTTTLTDASSTDLTRDFGYQSNGRIGDTIFNDANGNGVPDTGEGINNVTVTLTGDHDGDGIDEVLTTTTDSDGLYSFDGLITNDGSGGAVQYQVDVVVGTLPAGANNTVDPNGGLDNTSITSLTDAAPTDLTQDFGYESSGRIGDTIFLDVNNNGVPDPGEGISGVTITLTSDRDNNGIDEVLTAVTDADGNYVFGGLFTTPAGVDYVVDVDPATLPDGVTQTVDPDATSDNSSSVSLTDGANVDLDQDFGYRSTGEVGDTVFLDVNNNGVPDPGEGLAGITLTLTGDHDGDGIDEILSTTTDSDGLYSFDGLVTNDGSGGGIPYVVAVDTSTLPIGAVQTVDPDATSDHASTANLTDAASTDLTRDFGYRGPGQIGDTVFLDANNNGVADPGEGISGVTLTLTGDHDGDGLDETLTTTTDADGNYAFGGLTINNGAVIGVPYVVDVDTGTLPPGVTQSFDPDATVDDSSATTLTDVAPVDLTRDFGYQATGQIGDTIFLDSNNNGVPDSGEGISGVRVTLTGDHDGDGTDEVLSAITDADGNYLFEGLTTNDGSGGGITYDVDVDTSTLPAGIAQTVDPDGPLDNSSTTTLTDAANTDLTRDFGYRGLGSIGDTIFLDVNNNGVPDPGEGLTGVRVTLTGDHDGDGIDEVLERVTDADGDYLFDGLVTDGGVDYQVDVDTGTLPPNVNNTVDPNGGLDGSSATTLTNGSPTDLDQDFGYRGSGQIGDTIFVDVNNDGSPAIGEGITGAIVRLTGDIDGDGIDETLTTTTGADGIYSFDGLKTSPTGITYTVTVEPTSLPDGVSQTVDPDGTLDDTSSVTLTDAADTDLDQDFGYRSSGSIGDTIFLDSNGNGVPDPGEGLGGVDVTLTGDIDGDGVPDTLNTTTAPDGTYLFEGLPSNDGSGGGVDYTVTVATGTLPLGVTNTTDPDGGAPNTSQVTLTDAVPDRDDQDFGYRATGVIGDTVFLDTDLSGTPDAGEGFENVTVTLTADIDGDGIDNVLTTTTDANGVYRFEGLPTNDGSGGFNYEVNVVYATLPAAYLPSVDPDGTLDNQSQVRLTDAANVDLDQDFGYIGNGSIGDTIFLDVNGNGLPDPGEELANVTVTLVGDIDGDGTDDTRTTTTDSNGNYLFDTLPTDNGSGGFDYEIQVDPATLPTGVTNTTDPDGGTANESDVRLTNTDEHDLDQDFGYMGPGQIGDTVFLDANGNGLPDPGEGISGVTVELVADFDGDGRVNKVKTTTDNTGRYLFEGLPVDDGSGNGITYTVKVDQEQGLTGTTLPIGVNNTTDPDGGNNSRSQATLTNANPSDLDQDFGYMAAGQIGDTVFLDLNDNGRPDPGEGLGGVTVELVSDFDGDGINEKLKTTTLSDGTYLFEGLPTDDGTGSASYSVKVDKEAGAVGATLPEGVSNTTDPDGGNNSRSVVSLTDANPVDLDQDFGYQGEGVIGDRVFLDVDGNERSGGSEGISGVEIELKVDLDGDGRNETFRTVTDSDGNYRFENLPVSDSGTAYRVKIDKTTLPPTVDNTVDPDGGRNSRSDLVLTTADPRNLDQDFGYRGPGEIGDTIFQDIDGDGQPSPGEGITGVTVELVGDFDNDGRAEKIKTRTNSNGEYRFSGLPVETPAGDGVEYKVKVDKEAGNVGATVASDLKNTVDPHRRTDELSETTLTTGNPVDLDQDFGYTSNGEIGDRVFLDLDGDGKWDAGEGIPDVEVSLKGDFDNDGRIEKVTVTTDSDGRYLFTGLRRNLDYDVEINEDTVPDGYINRFDPDGGNDFTSSLNLDVRRNKKQDFGFIQPVDLAIEKDNTHPYDLAVAGEEYTYEIVVTNNGPGYALNSKVVDRLPDEIVSATWTATGTNGTKFTRSGSGDIVETVKIPEGGSITYTVTAQTAEGFEGDVVNEARVKVTSGQPETNPDNNLSRDRTTVAEMNIIDLNTPVAGSPSTLSSRGQTNEASLVTFYASRRRGTFDVPNTGLTLGLENPILIGTGFLCDAGTIEVIWDVPEGSEGQTWFVQSAEIDPTERVSNVTELVIGSDGSGSGSALGIDSRHHPLEPDFADIEGHILTIRGTDDADQIHVNIDGDEVRVEVNGESLEVNAVDYHLHRIDIRSEAGDDVINVISTEADRSALFSGYSIQAGDGDDTIVTEHVDGLIRGNAGDDVISTLSNGEQRLLVEGGEGNDQLTATGSTNATLEGGSGNDTLTGGDGNDILRGDSGDDVITGLNGNDRIDAGAGNDVAYGSRGRDIIVGGVGNDTLHGGFANDLILGGEGNDDVNGGRGSDIVVADAMAFEHDGKRLASIRRTWQQSDDRVEALVDSQTGLLRSRVVSNDGDNDTVRGGDGSDVLFASLTDQKLDLDLTEQLFDSI